MKENEIYIGLLVWDEKNQTASFISSYDNKNRILKVYSAKVDMEVTFYLEEYNPIKHFREMPINEMISFFRKNSNYDFQKFQDLWIELNNNSITSEVDLTGNTKRIGSMWEAYSEWIPNSGYVSKN